MKKILYSIILSTALLTACGSNKVNSDINTVESSIDDEFQTIESELTDQINSISPYWDNFVKNVRVSQHNDGISVTVDINCHGFESIGQEFILVRNSVTEYAKVHDYPVSFISIYSMNDEYEGVGWISDNLKEGSYVDKINDNTILRISLESLAESDTVKLSKFQDLVTETVNNTYNALMISAGKDKEGYFDGDVVDGYASGKGIFYSTNSSGYSYELHANFINGYIDGETELISETGDKVCGSYTMGIKNGTFMYYSHEIGEFSKEYKDGEQIGDVKYIKVNDSYVYSLADQSYQPPFQMGV